VSTALKADVEAVISVAESQVGVTEMPWGSNRTPYTSWYGMVGPWCAMFTSWAFAHGGSPLPEITPNKPNSGFAYCPSGVNWAKQQGTWRPSSSSYEPKRGDIVFFDFIGRPSHVGIVTGRTADGRITTIEGNTNPAGSRTGGMCMRHNRSRRGSTIGYIEVADTKRPSAPPPKPQPTVLQNGSSGIRVTFLQLALNAFTAKVPLGNRKPITVDGEYGPQTTARVREFERWSNGMLQLAAAQQGKKAEGLLHQDGKTTDPTLAALAFWRKAVGAG
jgi:hypothetical protein